MMFKDGACPDELTHLAEIVTEEIGMLIDEKQTTLDSVSGTLCSYWNAQL